VSRKLDSGGARRPDVNDALVSLRVRARRLECHLSQTELGNQIGVTFQQVQKYENGSNRIGAGRLERIAKALEVPVTFFFAAAGSGSQPIKSIFSDANLSGSIRLLKALNKIEGRKSRQLLISMAESLAEASQDGGKFVKQ
jgi:transcriptional regulator with XRE-family HTH domain